MHYNAGLTYLKTGKPCNIEPEICTEIGLPAGSMMRYNSFVNPSTSCKTDKELVKEVTPKNHST